MFELRPCIAFSAAALAMSLGSGASATVLQDFTGSGTPGWGWGGWTTTAGADGLAISSPTNDGGNGTWVKVGNTGISADATDVLRVTAKLGAGNVSPFFRVVLTDEDGVGAEENWLYRIDASLLNTTTFTAVDIPLTNYFSLQPAGPLTGDGVINFGAADHEGVKVFSIESEYNAAAGAIEVTVASVELVTVPEPGSLALLGLGGLAMLRRRRA